MEEALPIDAGDELHPSLQGEVVSVICEDTPSSRRGEYRCAVDDAVLEVEHDLATNEEPSLGDLGRFIPACDQAEILDPVEDYCPAETEKLQEATGGGNLAIEISVFSGIEDGNDSAVADLCPSEPIVVIVDEELPHSELEAAAPSSEVPLISASDCLAAPVQDATFPAVERSGHSALGSGTDDATHVGISESRTAVDDNGVRVAELESNAPTAEISLLSELDSVAPAARDFVISTANGSLQAELEATAPALEISLLSETGKPLEASAEVSLIAVEEDGAHFGNVGFHPSEILAVPVETELSSADTKNVHEPSKLGCVNVVVAEGALCTEIESTTLKAQHADDPEDDVAPTVAADVEGIDFQPEMVSLLSVAETETNTNGEMEEEHSRVVEGTAVTSVEQHVTTFVAQVGSRACGSAAETDVDTTRETDQGFSRVVDVTAGTAVEPDSTAFTAEVEAPACDSNRGHLPDLDVAPECQAEAIEKEPVTPGSAQGRETCELEGDHALVVDTRSESNTCSEATTNAKATETDSTDQLGEICSGAKSKLLPHQENTDVAAREDPCSNTRQSAGVDGSAPTPIPSKEAYFCEMVFAPARILESTPARNKDPNSPVSEKEMTVASGGARPAASPQRGCPPNSKETIFPVGVQGCVSDLVDDVAILLDTSIATTTGDFNAEGCTNKVADTTCATTASNSADETPKVLAVCSPPGGRNRHDFPCQYFVLSPTESPPTLGRGGDENADYSAIALEGRFQFAIKKPGKTPRPKTPESQDRRQSLGSRAGGAPLIRPNYKQQPCLRPVSPELRPQTDPNHLVMTPKRDSTPKRELTPTRSRNIAESLCATPDAHSDYEPDPLASMSTYSVMSQESRFSRLSRRSISKKQLSTKELEAQSVEEKRQQVRDLIRKNQTNCRVAMVASDLHSAGRAQNLVRQVTVPVEFNLSARSTARSRDVSFDSADSDGQEFPLNNSIRRLSTSSCSSGINPGPAARPWRPKLTVPQAPELHTERRLSSSGSRRSLGGCGPPDVLEDMTPRTSAAQTPANSIPSTPDRQKALARSRPSTPERQRTSINPRTGLAAAAKSRPSTPERQTRVIPKTGGSVSAPSFSRPSTPERQRTGTTTRVSSSRPSTPERQRTGTTTRVSRSTFAKSGASRPSTPERQAAPKVRAATPPNSNRVAPGTCSPSSTSSSAATRAGGLSMSAVERANLARQQMARQQQEKENLTKEKFAVFKTTPAKNPAQPKHGRVSSKRAAVPPRRTTGIVSSGLVGFATPIASPSGTPYSTPRTSNLDTVSATKSEAAALTQRRSSFGSSVPRF